LGLGINFLWALNNYGLLEFISNDLSRDKGELDLRDKTQAHAGKLVAMG
jgi:hypothetical protein